jgi:phage tail sheath gpL-like
MPNQNTLAAFKASSVQNVAFAPLPEVLPRKILITGTYDPSKTVTENTPQQVFSPDQVAVETGAGFMLHRLAVNAFLGNNKETEVFYQAQAEAGGATASAGDIDFTGGSGVLAGTFAFYVANIRVAINVTDAMTDANIAAALNTAINADPDLPITSAINVTPEILDFTAKSKGPWGDRITLKTNLQVGDKTPTGVVFAITAMTGGAGVPDISTALDALGTDDLANEDHYTDHVHGYGQDTTTLNAISNYVGAGDQKVGLYAKLVARPFRSLTGDIAAGSGGLSALIALGDGRKLDRANGVVAAPGSASHPEEIAALAIGIMAKKNNNTAESAYIGEVLTGVDTGATADRWTNNLDSGRDLAVNAGISPTLVVNGVLTLQNVVSFYHPDEVSQNNNAYRSMRNISIIQNVLDADKKRFEQDDYKSFTIVADKTKVTNSASAGNVKDLDDVKGDLAALIEGFETRAWIFSSVFPLEQLSDDPNSVVIRGATNGFDNTIKLILSGEGGIVDTEAQVDISIAVLG